MRGGVGLVRSEIAELVFFWVKGFCFCIAVVLSVVSLFESLLRL